MWSPPHTLAQDSSSSGRHCAEEQGVWLASQPELGQAPHLALSPSPLNAPPPPPAAGSQLVSRVALESWPLTSGFPGMFPNLPSGLARGEGLARGILPPSAPKSPADRTSKSLTNFIGYTPSPIAFFIIITSPLS